MTIDDFWDRIGIYVESMGICDVCPITFYRKTVDKNFEYPCCINDCATPLRKLCEELYKKGKEVE